MKNPKTFKVTMGDSDLNFEEGQIEDLYGFHEALLDFIYDKYYGKNEDSFVDAFEDGDLVCYLVNENEEQLDIKLLPEGYEKAIRKCKDYFEEEEAYENCGKIKKLLDEHF